jgi:hypothetical protein
MDSVVVTEGLDWKLHGFDLLSELALPVRGDEAASCGSACTVAIHWVQHSTSDPSIGACTEPSAEHSAQGH